MTRLPNSTDSVVPPFAGGGGGGGGGGSDYTTSSGATIKARTAYVADSGAGEWLAIDLADGSTIWGKTSANTVEDIAVSPQGEYVYCLDTANLYKLDTSDGSEVWSSPVSVSDGTGMDVDDAGYIYVTDGNSGATLDKYDSTGSSVWSVTAQSSGASYEVVVNGGYVGYAGEDTINLYDYSGTELWSKSYSGFNQGVHIEGEALYCTSMDKSGAPAPKDWRKIELSTGTVLASLNINGGSTREFPSATHGVEDEDTYILGELTTGLKKRKESDNSVVWDSGIDRINNVRYDGSVYITATGSGDGNAGVHLIESDGTVTKVASLNSPERVDIH